MSEETRAWCDSIAGLSGRDLYKAIAEEYLRRTNQPPVAALKLDRVQPDRVDLNASTSKDRDGFPHIYYFRLEDAATGEVVAGPVTTREPVASLRLNGKRPPKVRAVAVVEDDERALDQAELVVDLPASCGSNQDVYCYPQAGAPGITTCTPTGANFTTSDLLGAAVQCNANITASTPVVLAAAGAAGGRGADLWPFEGSPGGLGGLAALGTTLDDLDQAFGYTTLYCFGIGNVGGHTDTASGAGGASTILRTCDNVSQTDRTRVLLIAGGGGGGFESTTNAGGGYGGGGAGASLNGGGGGGGGSYAAQSTLALDNNDTSLWGKSSGSGGIYIYFQP